MTCSRNLFTGVICVLAIGCGLSGSTARAQGTTVMLTPYRAQYDVHISVLGGTLTTDVTAAGPGFMARSVIEPTGMSRIIARGAIRESSYFLIDADGVRPTQYRSVDTLSSEDKTVSLDFDWRHGEVTGMINDEPFKDELSGRVHDRVSIQYELMLDLLEGKASREYSLLDADELKLLQVRTIGTKTVKVPFGTFEATGIQHNKENSSRVTTLWCAKDLGYLPVIIEQHRDGKLGVRAVLTRYEAKPAENTATGSTR